MISEIGAAEGVAEGVRRFVQPPVWRQALQKGVKEHERCDRARLAAGRRTGGSRRRSPPVSSEPRLLGMPRRNRDTARATPAGTGAWTHVPAVAGCAGDARAGYAGAASEQPVHPHYRLAPRTELNLYVLQQRPYRAIPRVLSHSVPARQWRNLQRHRLGPFLGEAPLPHRRVLTPPSAPALRPVEPAEQPPCWSQQLRQTRKARPLGAPRHQPLLHSMGEHVAQPAHQRTVVQHRLCRVAPLPEAPTPVHQLPHLPGEVGA